jgi:chromosome partitioning protein
MGRAKVVSFINYKGGVGKTTTTYHVGCSLAQHFNKKVLFIDIDPQTNLTFLCAAVEEWENFKKRNGTIATMYERHLARKAVDTKRIIWQSPIQFGNRRISNLDLIPCDVELLGEDLGGGQLLGRFPSLEAMRRQAKEFLRERLFLAQAIREVEERYDYVLIDCPPNLYLMTQNALVASQHYVITAIPDHLSTIGLRILQTKVRKIGDWIKSAATFSDNSNRVLTVAQLGGIIFVKVRIGGSMLTTTHQEKMVDVAGMHTDGLCFPEHTTELIGYSEAAENHLPVWLHSSDNAKRAAKKNEYQSITEEFLRRF